MMLIVMHSPKGGVGTTFLTAQLALAMATHGHEVTAIDATAQDSLKLHMGFPPEQVVPDLSGRGDRALIACGVTLRQGHASRNSKDHWDRTSLERLSPPDGDRLYILDVPSENRSLFNHLLPFCDLHICPLMPTASSLATLPHLGRDEPLASQSKTVFVINQLDDRLKLARYADNFLREVFGDRLIARIRRDEAVNEALARFEPIAKHAPHAAVLPDLARFAEAVEAWLPRSTPYLAEAAQ